MNNTLRRIHAAIDNSRNSDGTERFTWQFEQAVELPIEFVLLIATAAPVVTGWRSAIANGLILSLRMFEAYWRREKGSTYGRHTENGGVAPLPEHKIPRDKKREKILNVITWIWPALATGVQAAETQAITWAVAIGMFATMVRIIIGAIAKPAWRASRMEWKALRAEAATATPDAGTAQ